MKNDIPVETGEQEKQCQCGLWHSWQAYADGELCDCGRRLFMVDQQWLDEHMYSEPGDLEPELNEAVLEIEQLAAFEHRLIETIKLKKHRLERLPEIIHDLEKTLRGVGQELADALEQHDQLSAAHKFLVARQQAAEAEA